MCVIIIVAWFIASTSRKVAFVLSVGGLLIQTTGARKRKQSGHPPIPTPRAHICTQTETQTSTTKQSKKHTHKHTQTHTLSFNHLLWRDLEIEYEY